MGIRGLTTYIAKHADQYLEPYELHDTYLVIDGNSMACQLYNWHARCNCAFGGDYDRYAQCVREFFDNLIKCKIVPLVLIDGGYENKKISTVRARLRSKIQMAANFNPTRKPKFFPLFMVDVFQDIMDERGVRYAQCAFEADDEIAAVARILGCPVLSYDSDFFVYGVLYIPSDTLDNGVAKSKNSISYVKKCKIYRVEKFLNTFGGLDRSLLPLVATLLGNDYIQRRVFNQFFSNLKLSKLTKKNSNEQQRRIAALLNWLKPYTLNTAVAGVLSRIQREQRRAVLKKMEAVINGYLNSFPSMLTALGFSQEYVAQVESKRADQTFKFQGDIDSAEIIEVSRSDESLESNDTADDDDVEDDDDDVEDDDDDGDNDDDDEEEKVISERNRADFSTSNFLASIAPPWFIVEYSKGHFPSYFIDIMYRQLYFLQPQIEDYFYPAAHTISLKLVSAIFELLTSYRKDLDKNLEYVIRDENRRVARYQLESCKEIFSHKFPSLEDLNTLPVNERKEILMHTLGISEEFSLDNIPPQWRLYLITIIYWAQQGHKPALTNCHIYSLLCSMMFGIIDQKIGFYRSQQKFTSKYSCKIQKITDKRQSIGDKAKIIPNTNITHAYGSVTVADCLIAAPFFISSFNRDPKTMSNVKAFNVTIIHSFAQFQSCLKHIIHLNALLKYPYVQPKVAEIYNGTLLYNLYNNFKKRNDVEAYINIVLKDSSTLLRLVNLLSNVIKVPLAEVFEYKVNQKRRRRNRNKPKKIIDDESSSYINENQIYDENVRFFDGNNRFCNLDSMDWSE